MRKTIYLLGLVLLCVNFTACEYDDSDLLKRVEDLEKQAEATSQQLATLQKLVDALAANKVIIKTEYTEAGYVITFSDNSTVTLQNGDSYFTTVEESDEAVTITTADGKQIILPKTSMSISFAEGVELRVKAGEPAEFDFTLNGAVDCLLADWSNEEWEVSCDGSTITIFAPENITDDNSTCQIKFLLYNERGDCKIYTLLFSAYYEIRTLTFEDADVKFESYTLDYANVEVNLWSDLIDQMQYGGTLLYGDFVSAPYHWADRGNTELASGSCEDGPFWSGGHAISNYYAADYSTIDYTRQLEVAVGSEGAAGHNGSANFCVQNGYVDASSSKTTLPAIYFCDGKERVVESMYVTNTSYTYATLKNGNGFTAPAGENTWYRIVAIGYDAEGNEVGECYFYLCQGKDKILNSWEKFDLSQLGKVAKIAFNIEASEDMYGDWGLNAPAYFAFDDIAVRY